MRILVQDLEKAYGSKKVLDGISFSAEPGEVTGFIGPNGAGKTTTLRILLGLDVADGGSASFSGVQYADLVDPILNVGVALDVDGMHPGQLAVDYLRSIGIPYGIPRSRIFDVLDVVGLGQVAKQRVGDFSLGMKQRLNIAGAMLGDPDVYIFDESLNGLDIDGIVWFREFIAALSRAGKTTLLSSHQMSEVELMAHKVVILGSGRILADSQVSELRGSIVQVTSPDAERFSEVLHTAGIAHSVVEMNLHISGLSAAQIGSIAAANSICLSKLQDVATTLEDAYRELVANAQEFRARRLEG